MTRSFTRELIARFALDGISGGNAVFNPEKLDWFNQQHILGLPTEELARAGGAISKGIGSVAGVVRGRRARVALRVLDLLKPRVKKLGQFVEDGRPFFEEAVTFDTVAVTEVSGIPAMRAHLHALRSRLGAAQPFAQSNLEILRGVAEERSLKPAALIHATRVATTGRAASPGLFEVLELLGRERTMRDSIARSRWRASKDFTVCLAIVSSHTPAELKAARLPRDSMFFAHSANPSQDVSWHLRCNPWLDGDERAKGGEVAKEDRGFASMDRARQREIASKGGKAAHQKGTAHEWTSEEARDAGRKGGLASHRRRREQKEPRQDAGRDLVGARVGRRPGLRVGPTGSGPGL